MHLANVDCVVLEMKNLLDVNKQQAISIVEELNVKGAPKPRECNIAQHISVCVHVSTIYTNRLRLL